MKFCRHNIDVILTSFVLLAKATGISGRKWKMSVKVLTHQRHHGVEQVELGQLEFNWLDSKFHSDVVVSNISYISLKPHPLSWWFNTWDSPTN